MNKHKYTIAEIRASFPAGKSAFDMENPLGHYVWRKLCYYPAWIFLRMGISANKITGLAIVVVITATALLALGLYWSTILGAVFVLLRALLDYVDGTVARCTGSASRFGGFNDTIHQYAITSLLPIGIGIGLFRQPDAVLQSISQGLFGQDVPGSLFLIAGFSASFFTLFTYCISDRFALSFDIKPKDFYRPTEKTKVSLWTLVYRLGVMLENTNGVMMIVLLLAAVFKFLSIFLIVWLAITASGFLAITARTLIKAESMKS